jgi:hypothetical protein
MSTTYTITEGALVQMYHGRPCRAWDLPEPPASIASVSVDDFGGNCFCAVIVLTDGRTVTIPESGPVQEENPNLALIYSSLDAAWECEPDQELRLIHQP